MDNFIFRNQKRDREYAYEDVEFILTRYGYKPVRIVNKLKEDVYRELLLKYHLKRGTLFKTKDKVFRLEDFEYSNYFKGEYLKNERFTIKVTISKRETEKLLKKIESDKQEGVVYMRYIVYVMDTETNEETENIIEVRKDVSMKTVALKGVEKHVEGYSDPLEFMREVKSLHKESEDFEEFAESLEQDLDLVVEIGDLNNHTFIHVDTINHASQRTTSSLAEGYSAYRQAWQDQLSSEGGEQDFAKYRPSDDILIEHGNELLLDNEDWVMEEMQWQIKCSFDSEK